MTTLKLKSTVKPPQSLPINEWFKYIHTEIVKMTTPQSLQDKFTKLKIKP